jgi:hypothetical protein
MSQRVLIVGCSESGKSTLARMLIEEAQQSVDFPLPVYVRDPLGYNWPQATGNFSNSEQLRGLITQFGSPAICAIDEAVDFFKPQQTENHWIFTNGRHFGLLPIAIAHRIKMMAPNVRSVATDIYVFESSKEDCEILAAEYNMPQVLEAQTFATGEFFHIRKEVGEDGKKRRIISQHSTFE